jgi:hypothetical protein
MVLGKVRVAAPTNRAKQWQNSKARNPMRLPKGTGPRLLFFSAAAGCGSDRPLRLRLLVAMVMAVGAVHVAVGDFFVGGGAHVDHRQLEAQRHAGQRMVAVEDDLVVGDVGDGEDHRFVVASPVGHAFELHADFQRLRQAVARLDLHQRGS